MFLVCRLCRVNVQETNSVPRVQCFFCREQLLLRVYLGSGRSRTMVAVEVPSGTHLYNLSYAGSAACHEKRKLQVLGVTYTKHVYNNVLAPVRLRPQHCVHVRTNNVIFSIQYGRLTRLYCTGDQGDIIAERQAELSAAKSTAISTATSTSTKSSEGRRAHQTFRLTTANSQPQNPSHSCKTGKYTKHTKYSISCYYSSI